MNSTLSLIKLLRPQQWAKNIFIFLPLFFNGDILNPAPLFSCVIAFFAFSFTASAIYCFNDIYDVEADRLHPKKSKRPIAAGTISISTAYITMFCCLLVSFLLLLCWGGANKYATMGLIGLYGLMNIAYCIKLKQFTIVDVMIIAIGFVLRIFVGGVVSDTFLSEWIVLMTFLLALFLAFAKRRDDVVIYQNSGVILRRKTDRYNLEFMNQVLTIIASVTLMAYIMYTVSPEVVERLGTRYVYITALFVLTGIIRYLQITIVDMKSGSPTEVLYKDHLIQGCILAWIVSFLLIIYI